MREAHTILAFFFYWLNVLTYKYSSLLVMSECKVVYRRFFQFWPIFPNRNYNSRLIEYNLNWCCHHALHLKKMTFPIFEYLLKTSGTTTKILCCLKIPLTSMRVLRTSFPVSRPRLVSYKKLFYSLCGQVLLQFLFSIMKGWK